MSYSLLKRLFALLAFSLLTTGVAAGSRQPAESILPIEDAVKVSRKVEEYAAEQGARVFFLARQGRPTRELPSGVNYTHVSYAVYSMVKTDDGEMIPGYAIYNLYQREDDPSKSHLVVDFTLDFLAGAEVAKVGVIIPKRSLQKRLLEVINSDSYAQLHNPDYSVLANPYDATYQNCTEHVLDVLNAAIYQTTDIEQLKLNTRAHFEAQKIRISPLKLLLGSLFKADIKTSDHKGGIRTATFGTLVNYLEKNDLVENVTHISL